MRPEKALSWYRRMSMLYGLGAWTLLGSLFLYNQRKSKPPGTALGRDLRGTRGLAWGVSGGVAEVASLCRAKRPGAVLRAARYRGICQQRPFRASSPNLAGLLSEAARILRI